MDHVYLTSDKLNIDDISELAAAANCGAISCFVGTTRDNFENKKVLYLEYEAYEPMALQSLKSVCTSIRNKFEVENIAIYHRLGHVPVKEASVVIAISSPHRKSSLEAVSFAIDSLKASVPIWKKEVYAGEEQPQWKENPEYLIEEFENEDKEEVVPDHLVQIHAKPQEIKRRIDAFISFKRSQANETNIKHFCLFDTRLGEREYSCARVNAVYSRRKAVGSDVKVHRVRNIVGPQSQVNAGPAADADKASSNDRLAQVEQHLKVEPPASTGILLRLKAVEDKILFLESLSPEYFPQTNEGKPDEKIKPIERIKTAKKLVTSEELNQKVRDLEMRLLMSSGSS